MSAHELTDKIEALKLQNTPESNFQLGELLANGPFEIRNVDQAIKYYTLAADAGLKEAQFALGLIYHPDLGLRPQHQNAITFLEKAANQDHVLASAMLSLIFDQKAYTFSDKSKAEYWLAKAMQMLKLKDERSYSSEEFLALGLINEPTNLKKSINYYELVAKLGNNHVLSSIALVVLGNFHRQGKGVEQNFIIAREYYKKAAALGYCIALLKLGLLYKEGVGVKQNYSEARNYFEKAAISGCGAALSNLGILYKDGLGVKQDYNKARECYEKAAALYCSAGLLNIGTLYEEGLGVKQDYNKAREYYEKAAATCCDVDIRAVLGVHLSNLGNIYKNGLRVKQDYNKARECYEKAAALGNSFALLNLGNIYQEGLGVQQSHKNAREYYNQAASQGNNMVSLAILGAALLNLDDLSKNGLGVKQDYNKARECSEAVKSFSKKDYATAYDILNSKLTRQEHPEGCCVLGLMYANGLGVEPNQQQAFKWLKKAAANNNLDAINILAALANQQHDLKLSLLRYQTSADNQHQAGLSALALINLQGLGCLVNQQKAEDYLYSAVNAIDSVVDTAIENPSASTIGSSFEISENFSSSKYIQCSLNSQQGDTKDSIRPLYALSHMMLGQQLLSRWSANQMQEANGIQQLKESISHFTTALTIANKDSVIREPYNCLIDKSLFTRPEIAETWLHYAQLLLSSVNPASKVDDEATDGEAPHGNAVVSHDNVPDVRNSSVINWPEDNNPDWLWLHKAISQDELVQSNAEADKGDSEADKSSSGVEVDKATINQTEQFIANLSSADNLTEVQSTALYLLGMFNLIYGQAKYAALVDQDVLHNQGVLSKAALPESLHHDAQKSLQHGVQILGKLVQYCKTKYAALFDQGVLHNQDALPETALPESLHHDTQDSLQRGVQCLWKLVQYSNSGYVAFGAAWQLSEFFTSEFFTNLSPQIASDLWSNIEVNASQIESRTAVDEIYAKSYENTVMAASVKAVYVLKTAMSLHSAETKNWGCIDWRNEYYFKSLLRLGKLLLSLNHSSFAQALAQEGLAFLKQAQQLHITEASFILGQWYVQHEHDYLTAVNMYTEAAKAGNTQAKAALAWLYYSEDAIQNQPKSREWAESAWDDVNKLKQLNSTDKVSWSSLQNRPTNNESVLNGKSENSHDSFSNEILYGLNDTDLIHVYLVLAETSRLGQGSEVNLEEAFNFYLLAANLDCAEAQYQCAAYYMQTKDSQKALSWYEKAAAHNHPEAIFALAKLYEAGKSVAQNLERAAKLYQKAADLGCKQAIKLLAIRSLKAVTEPNFLNESSNSLNAEDRHCSLDGSCSLSNSISILADSVNSLSDPRYAFEVLHNLAQEGDLEVQIMLAHYFENLKPVHQDSKSLKQSDRAVDYYALAAEQGHVLSQFKLAQHYLELQAYPESFLWFKKVADLFTLGANELPLGYSTLQTDAYSLHTEANAANITDAQELWKEHLTQACLQVAQFYENGQGVKQHLKTAVQWYERASDLGCQDARFKLACIYLKGGEGVKTDERQSVTLLSKLAKRKHAPAMYLLGKLYMEGSIVKTDLKQAFSLIKGAAELKHPEAAFMLSQMYAQGKGTPINQQLAQTWLKKAKNLGWK